VLALVTGWWHLSFRRHKREDEIIEPPVLHHGGEKSKAADS
jgi:hypothetical protein